MLTNERFSVLNALRVRPYAGQRGLAALLGYSLGKTNGLLSSLKADGLLTEGYLLTEEAYKSLAPYRVDNAVIMAAGMSSRLAPLSYEKPKGLLVVKGEVLIERQIRQLQSAGIKQITVVVGYMKEQFFYLQEKFGVELVVNEDYYRYNNTSTLLRVLDRLKNTYVCSSDNYFADNVFEEYVYDSYYSAVYMPGKSREYGLITDSKGRIAGIDRSPCDRWVMLGHAYFSRSFSERFAEILLREYDAGDTKYKLWEDLLERHLDELTIYVRRYDRDRVKEFDSLEELRDFDDRYLKNSGSGIFPNICRVLDCEESDIGEIEVIKQGLTNLSFRFSCRGQRYIYRHPGVGTEKYISRRSEAFSMEVAKRLGLDNTVIEISGSEGWKISRYIENARQLDYGSEDEVKKALAMIKKLHDAAIRSDFDFDIWKKTLSLIDNTVAAHKDFPDFYELQGRMSALYEKVRADGVPWVLCHCDCYNPNFLLDDAGNMTLIDWEYSGNDDPANDLGTFICCSDYTYEQALHIFDLYYGRRPTDAELRHDLAYVAIASYYWYVWAVYQESIGNTIGEYLFLWYNNTKLYLQKAAELYERKET